MRRASFAVMIQENEALGLIKCKMIQLEDGVKRKMIRLDEEAKAIEGDLVRFAAAHKHSLLPNEILSRIFVLAAQDYGAVVFPMSKTKFLLNLLYLTCVHTGARWLFVHRSYGVTRASIRKITFYRLSTFTNDG